MRGETEWKAEKKGGLTRFLECKGSKGVNKENGKGGGEVSILISM